MFYAPITPRKHIIILHIRIICIRRLSKIFSIQHERTTGNNTSRTKRFLPNDLTQNKYSLAPIATSVKMLVACAKEAWRNPSKPEHLV